MESYATASPKANRLRSGGYDCVKHAMDGRSRDAMGLGDLSHRNDRCFHASPIQQNYIRPAAERLSLAGVGWHAFRHTCRTWLDEAGAPIGVQQKLMRRAQPSTTMNYENSQMKAKRRANGKVVRMALHAAGRKKRVA